MFLKRFPICQMLFLFTYVLEQFYFKDEKTETPVTCPDPWLLTLSACWLDAEQGSHSGSHYIPAQCARTPVSLIALQVVTWFPDPSPSSGHSLVDILLVSL